MFANVFLILIVSIALQVALAPSAFAYLDPGTGSYIFQILAAAIIGGIYTVKMYWQRIKNFFRKIFSNK